MANHNGLESAPMRDTIDHKVVASADGPSPLQLDAGLGGPPAATAKHGSGSDSAANQNPGGGGDKAHDKAQGGHLVDHYRDAYMLNTKDSEAQFLAKEPARMREHYGLDKNASSGKLFDRMTEDSYKVYKGSSPELKDEVKREYGLPAGKGDIPEAVFKKAHMDFLHKAAGLDGSASPEALEKALNKQNYEAVKAMQKPGAKGKLPDHIDFD